MKRIVVFLVSIMAVFALAACSSGDQTLEDLYNSDTEFAQQINDAEKEAVDTSDGEFSDVAIEFEGNKIIYKFTFTEAIDEDMVPVMEEALSAEADDITAEMDSAAEDAGLDAGDITIQMIFVNPDGSEAVNFTF